MNADELGYRCAPWDITWHGLNIEELQRTETTFALSNGHLGMRGTLDEGEPRGLPGTYLNGFHERYVLSRAESGYGDPEYGQTMINVTDGKLIRLLVDDELLDLRYGQINAHERVLDFRSGTLKRTTDWTSPAGRRVRIHSERLVSFTQRAMAVIRYEVEPVDTDVQLVVQSDLLTNEPIVSESRDPRAAAAIDSPLVCDFGTDDHYRALLVHRTRESGLRLAAAMDHEIQASNDLRTRMHREDDLARLTAAVDVPAGERLRVTKYLAYGWSARRSVPSLRAQVEAALTGAFRTGWEGFLTQQRSYLDRFWESADVQVEGHPQVQQAVRFALFHLLQATARGEKRPIAAKGLTGPGYEGHVFWEAETYVIPVLIHTAPEAAHQALRWRHSVLDRARARARVLGLRGASFPWRTINGDECSAYWPAGTAGFHVSADIAYATQLYIDATGDDDFDRHCGTELLVETARVWPSLGHFDSRGWFRIDGVTGPDEYTALRDNNTYTNLMVQRNLYNAASACQRNPDIACRLGVDEAEMTQWKHIADAMTMRDPQDGVHPESDGFTELDEWDFNRTTANSYPLLLHYPYFELYRKQVVKQADLVLAMYLCGDAFTAEQKERNFHYYEARTVRDSSLSASIQSIMAAEVGHLDLAFDYLVETALTDIEDSHRNVRNGLHLGALGGTWHALVAGFGGMRRHGDRVAFAPRLPDALDSIAFRLHLRGSCLSISISRNETSYRLISGEPVELDHYGQTITVDTDHPQVAAIPAFSAPRDEPKQPPGCHPRDR